MVDFKVGGVSLTNREKEVLTLLTIEYLTPAQIALRRKCSKQAVHKIIKSLVVKGAYNRRTLQSQAPSETKVDFFGVTPRGGGGVPPFPMEQIRLHAQRWRIEIINKSIAYNLLREKANTIKLDLNTVRLHKDVVEVYSNNSFYGDTANNATVKSLSYWDGFFVRLEQELKVTLIKPRHNNIKLVYSEYAQVNNELAKQCNINQEKIKVYAKEDGKLWFLIDNSFKLHEAETVHAETAERDMQEVITPFFNDLRRNPVTMSEIMDAINSLVQVNKETASGLNAVVTYLKSQLPTEEPETLTERPRYIG
jgi:DNA-binding CsgD family transcriptional regulator